MGHRSSGKTSLGDLLLFTAGVTRSPGRVEHGTSLLDHEADERRRKVTMGPAFAWMEWEDHLLQLIDTPGSALLAHERDLAAVGADAHVVVVSASDGVEYGTEHTLAVAAQMDKARLVVVSKADRAHDLDGILLDLEEAAGVRPLPVQLPFYDDDGQFSGVVSVLDRRVYRYALDGSGAFSPEPLPERLRGEVDAALDRVMETVALTDDELLEHYLEYLELPDDLLWAGLRRGISAGLLLPVLYASASRCMGAGHLLDFFTRALPSPLEGAPRGREFDGSPFEVTADGPTITQLLCTRLDEDGERYHVVRVWGGTARPGKWVNAETGTPNKVRKLYEIRGPRRAQARNTFAGAILATWDGLDGTPGDTFTNGPRVFMPAPALPAPMMAWLLEPAEPRHQEKLGEALTFLISLDPALRLHTDAVTGGLLLAGLSEPHLERAARMLDKLGVPVQRQLPPVAYREQPRQRVHGIQGVHERSVDGLVEEFGACEVELEPIDHSDGVRMEWQAQGEQVPSRFSAPCDTGARRAMRHGPTAGYPVVGANVRVVGGEYDILQSTDDHFEKAAEIAASNALAEAGTHILEPWSRVEIWTPAADVGDILSEISANRGRIVGLDVQGRDTRIEALYPYRELRIFGPRLQTLTQGRGRFTASHSHYDVVPNHLVSEAIRSSPFIDRNRERRYAMQAQGADNR